jgi:hypothetical protein
MMKSPTTQWEHTMSKRHLRDIFVKMGWGFSVLTLAVASRAADNFTAVSAADKPVKTRKAKAPKPPGLNSSAESKAERDKRLLRECRGKANAGACEGFAS